MNAQARAKRADRSRPRRDDGVNEGEGAQRLLMLDGTRDEAAYPFVKWAGGKRQLLREILSALPRDFTGTYYEPFIGGGAVFFGLRPIRAVLSDSNERLIRTYRAIRDRVEDVIERLKGYRNEKPAFLAARRIDIDAGTDVDVAAWFIFLNKTGFNGLYRVNRQNIFNVPFGDNQRARVCDEANLRACSRALASTELACEDFASVIDRARRGDLVYCDPPYVPVSASACFTSYTAGGFGSEDQRRLRDVARGLKRRGVFVLLSNSDSPLVRQLYELDFECIPVAATRMVNSDSSGRGPVQELLMR